MRARRSSTTSGGQRRTDVGSKRHRVFDAVEKRTPPLMVKSDAGKRDS